MLSLEQRIDLLDRLGKYILQYDEAMDGVIEYTYLKNKWFTKENTKQALQNIAEHYLVKPKLESFVAEYEISSDQKKVIGLILAGNIPAVGFHDVMCSFLCGHKTLMKFSDKDSQLIPFLIDKMSSWDTGTKDYFERVAQLKDFDAIIATGSNHSTGLFKKYFSAYPNIIRGNRNGVAVLNGDESQDQLNRLGEDIFQYFGMGCRNVSKVYVPKGYDFNQLLETTHEFKNIVNHNKYKNNFDYNYAILVLNKEKFWNNGCLIIKEDELIPSRISTLHYEEYSDLEELQKHLNDKLDKIQCICTDIDLPKIETITLGASQIPAINQFADNVDTVQFLTNL